MRETHLAWLPLLHIEPEPLPSNASEEVFPQSSWAEVKFFSESKEGIMCVMIAHKERNHRGCNNLLLAVMQINDK